MALTDSQKLALAGAVAGVTTLLAAILLVGYFRAPARALEPVPAPALSHRIADLVDQIRQVPAEDRRARLRSFQAPDGVVLNLPALEAAFDALAEAGDVQVVRVQDMQGRVVEATLEYTGPDGHPARVALLFHLHDDRIIPLTVSP